MTSKTRTPAAPPAKPRRIARPDASAATPCPVAALAEDYAAMRRLTLRLREDDPNTDMRLIKDIAGRAENLASSTVRELAAAAYDRQVVTRKMAVHRRATSAKGAMFQLYLLAERLADLDDPVALDIPMELYDRVKHGLDELREESRQLLYSATAQLERHILDADLATVREAHMTPAFDVAAEMEALAFHATPKTPVH